MDEHGRSRRNALLIGALETQLDRAANRPDRRLPAERDLSLLMKCSRAEVRRLLVRLEEEGRITRHVGRGTFVTEARGRLRAPDPEFAPAALMTVARLFEPQVAALAALSATREQLHELTTCLEQGAVLEESWEALEHWDVALHRGIAVATNNPQIVAMIDLLNSARNTPLWAQLKRGGVTPKAGVRIQQEHAEIVAAVVARDHDGAFHAMARHIGSVRRSVLRIGE